MITLKEAVTRAGNEADMVNERVWSETFCAALESNGFVIVPLEATDEMREAFFKARDEYSQLKKDQIFPRPTLADFCFNGMLASRPNIAEAKDA